MGKSFNVTGTCIPEEDYMVDITAKLAAIKEMINRREYFTINRGRQFGKTTTLTQLERFLADDYIVISISFETFGNATFQTEEKFCQAFLRKIKNALKFANVAADYRDAWHDLSVIDFDRLSDHITEMCEDKKIVLMIDEVDKASNHYVFLDFLSKLRSKFLARKNKRDFTFHSVILAGVYDIRNIKLKMKQEGLHKSVAGETATYNSPWNIASQFKVDLSFSVDEIATMLLAYERDKKTGMQEVAIAKEIHHYTNGYPVLTSSICKVIDEHLKDWTTGGVRRAVKLILKEEIPLFDSLIKNLDANKELADLLYNIIIMGRKWIFNIHDEATNLGFRYGYFVEQNGKLVVSNKIFEACLLNYLTTKKAREVLSNLNYTTFDETGIIVNNMINLDTCMIKFSEHMQKNYNTKDERFIEREGRLLFLTYLAPILNGRGFSYIEAQTLDGKRTDVIVNYSGSQFIIELKIWDGEAKHEKAKEQLLGYMEKFQVDQGYLLTFDFRETKNVRNEWMTYKGKAIFDVIV